MVRRFWCGSPRETTLPGDPSRHPATLPRVKKKLALVGVLAVAAGGYVAAAHFSGGAFPTPGLEVGGDRGELRRITTSFLEDIQFKDFKTAASYHPPDKREQVDIPYLLQRLFQVKPEALDIMSYEVVFADIDTTGNRGRVKTRVKVKELLRGDIRDQEVIFYYDRVRAGAPWYMKLEDSLRQIEAEKGKKH